MNLASLFVAPGATPASMVCQIRLHRHTMIHIAKIAEMQAVEDGPICKQTQPLPFLTNVISKP